MPQDRLLYFNQKAKGEAIRMLHALADKPLTDEVIEKKVWPVVKSSEYHMCVIPYQLIFALR